MPKKQIVKDHLGQTFPSQTKMLKHWGVNKSVYWARNKKGLSLKECLTGPNEDMLPQDHLGNKFNSQSEMLKHYNITQSAFEFRIKQGWSLEKSLTTPVRNTKKVIQDHKGNQFESIAAMCKHYNINVNCFNNRINVMNMSIEDALTMNSIRISIDEPITKQNMLLSQAAKMHNVKDMTAFKRWSKGLSIYETLNMIPILNRQIDIWKCDDNFIVISSVGNESANNKKDDTEYFLCEYKGNEIICNKAKIIQYYCNNVLPTLQNQSA